jgi:hypothetical protein
MNKKSINILVKYMRKMKNKENYKNSYKYWVIEWLRNQMNYCWNIKKYRFMKRC